jgi:hypothetical protein
MKSIVPLSVAVSLLGAGAVIAQDHDQLGRNRSELIVIDSKDLERDAGGKPVSTFPHPALEPAGLQSGFGLDGTVERSELAAMPREGQAPSEPAAVDRAAAAAPRVPATPLAAFPLDSLRATRERPVFSESRRPPAVAVAEPMRSVEPPPEPEAAEPEAPGLTLIGTVVGGQGTIAVFLNSVARDVVRLHLGEADSGWTLRSVAPKTTTLEKDSRQVTLSLPAPDAQSASGGDAASGIDAFMQPPLFDAAPGNHASRRKPPVPFQSGTPSRAMPPRGQPGPAY